MGTTLGFAEVLPFSTSGIGEDMVSLGRMVFAGALTLFVAAPAFADPEHGNGGNGNHYGWSHSAPGPEMGGGLSALIAGGYFWYRRRKSKRDDK
jgi:hypothetical protein